MAFQKLPELVNRFLVPPDPIVLHYTINPASPPPERPQAYDVEVKMEDTALKHRMAVTINANKDSAHTLLKLDEEVGNFFFLFTSHVISLFLRRFLFLLSPSITLT